MSPVTSTWFGAVVLAASVAATVPGSAGEVEANGESQPSPLRGIGILFLDSRDSEDVVKERIRRLLREAAGGDVPVEEHQKELGRELETLLAFDWAAPEELPQLSLQSYRHATAGSFYGALRQHPLARQSEKVCPQACLLRELGPDGMHIHLTKPLDGPGDTVLVLKFSEAYGSAAGSGEEELSGTPDLRDAWLKQYSEFDDIRKPVGRLFGLQVFLGDSRPRDEVWDSAE